MEKYCRWTKDLLIIYDFVIIFPGHKKGPRGSGFQRVTRTPSAMPALANPTAAIHFQPAKKTPSFGRAAVQSAADTPRVQPIAH
jgi:hypothetical protein